MSLGSKARDKGKPEERKRPECLRTGQRETGDRETRDRNDMSACTAGWRHWGTSGAQGECGVDNVDDYYWVIMY